MAVGQCILGGNVYFTKECNTGGLAYIYSQYEVDMEALGDCYAAAGRFIMGKSFTEEEDRYILVHAEVAGQGALDGTNFGHAFVIDTLQDLVIDKSNGGNTILPARLYYRIGQIGEINNFYEYTYDEAARKMSEFKHFGPWDLETSTGL